jgi:hypothetical protein
MGQNRSHVVAIDPIPNRTLTREPMVIDEPREPSPYEAHGHYAGQVRRVIRLPLPFHQPHGHSFKIKIYTPYKYIGDCRASAEGSELKEYVHFDGHFRPVNPLAVQIIASLVSPPVDPEDIGALKGRAASSR